MSTLFLLCAGGLSAIWLLVHLIMGGREVAKPLLASEAPSQVVRETMYLCWHMTTASIAFMAVLFIAAAWMNEPAFAFAATLLAFAFSGVGIGLVFGRKLPHAMLPQGWLFVPVALLGIMGLQL